MYFGYCLDAVHKGLIMLSSQTVLYTVYVTFITNSVVVVIFIYRSEEGVEGGAEGRGRGVREGICTYLF